MNHHRTEGTLHLPIWLQIDVRAFQCNVCGMIKENADMSLTNDPKDPRLTHGADDKPAPQAQTYLVLSDEERAKGFIRPLRLTYRHNMCGTTTTMSRAIAETYARDPFFYGATYCVECGMHRPVSEFVWTDGEVLGS